MSEARGGEGKVAFADALRGIAALLVVQSHLLGMAWFDRGGVQALTGLPMPSAEQMPTPTWLLFLQPVGWLSTGSLGVALFFLISGFVIPFSLDKHGLRGFAISRFWRIYPTYAAGFAVGFAALMLAGAVLPEKAQRAKTLFHLTPGLHNLMNGAVLDGVIWTLNVEVMFYLWLALLFAATGRRWARMLDLSLAVGVLAAGLLLLPAAHGFVVSGVVNDALFYLRFFLFMLMGTVLNRHHTGRMPLPAAALRLLLLFALFYTLWQWPERATVKDTWVNYLLALGIFGAGYLGRRRIRLSFAPLRHLAALSYSLYAVHALLGYALFSVLGRMGLSANLSIALTLPAVLGMAVAIWYGVEAPTHRIGRRLARRLPENSPFRAARTDETPA